MKKLRRHHDMGGLPSGAVSFDEHIHAPWEKRTNALLRLLADEKRNLVSVDELRRAIEDLGPGAYDELNYYERWISAITNVLWEKGVISVDELGRKLAEVEERFEAARAETGA